MKPPPARFCWAPSAGPNLARHPFRKQSFIGTQMQGCIWVLPLAALKLQWQS